MISLGDFLEQIAHDVAQANEVAAGAALKRLLDRCEEDPEGTLKPILRALELGQTVVHVPEIGLVQPAQNPLVEFEIELNTRVDLGTSKTLADGKVVPDIMLSFQKSNMLGRGTEIKLRAKFAGADPTETQEVIRDQLVKELHQRLGA